MGNTEYKNRILTVDDDPTFIAIITEFLKACSYDVLTAANAKEAIELFLKFKPDLVLSDLYMPGMSGLQLLEYFKNEFPDTPVIVISGACDINNAISALRLGAWDFILKPFTQPVLDQTIQRVLEKLKLITENKKIRSELELKNYQLAQGLEQLQTDQKAGENVQQHLLPKPFQNYNDYIITFKILPSLYLSGDFVDYFKITDDKIGFYIADVSGHGASSAFVTVMLKASVDQMLAKFIFNNDDTILHPEMVLKQLSDQIYSARLGKYITMIYCILDLRKNTLQYSLGGHYPNPILRTEDKVAFLKGNGFAVGIFEHAQFSCESCELPPEFIMLMLSDGIFEIMDGKNLEENENTLLSITNNSRISIETLLNKLGIARDRGFPDDITLLLMSKRKAENFQAKQP